jgi:hypothetical protein
MFIRFAVLQPDADTGKKCGVLVAGHTLRDEGDLSVEEHRQLRLCLKWFNENVKQPGTYDNLHNKRALSWFRSSADECIRHMWDLKQILDHHGLHVEVLKTKTPGTIVYEDECQVVAIPPKGAPFE